MTYYIVIASRRKISKQPGKHLDCGARFYFLVAQSSEQSTYRRSRAAAAVDNVTEFPARNASSFLNSANTVLIVKMKMHNVITECTETFHNTGACTPLVPLMSAIFLATYIRKDSACGCIATAQLAQSH